MKKKGHIFIILRLKKTESFFILLLVLFSTDIERPLCSIQSVNYIYYCVSGNIF